MKAAASKGKLYVCPTPIGNLADITLRVLEVLKSVDLIAAEDTRHTKKLLAHYGINTPLVSYHSHNQKIRGGELIARLAQGEKIALVSDAGTPGISDPGALLVKEALARGIPVEALPGPSAVLTALVVSGLDTSRFVFEGFLPVRRRRRALEELADERRTIILFEAPHRLVETLEAILAILGDRPVAVARELTKVHEEVFRGKVSEALSHFRDNPPKGEITIILSGRETAPKGECDRGALPSPQDLLSFVRALTEAGMQKRAAIKEAARRFGLSAREIYALVEKAKRPTTSP